MPQQISDVDSFRLALRDDMQAAVPRIRCEGSTIDHLLAILVHGGVIYERTLVVDFLSKAPRVEELERAWLDGVGAASQ